MKTSLDSEARNELMEYRLTRAQDTIREADYNASGEYYNAAVNRLYYACYYAASALMLSEHLETATHSGIKSMIGLKFVKTGKLEPKYGRIYQQLFENRQSGDYEDFVYCDKELYNELRPQAQEFITRITQLITKK